MLTYKISVIVAIQFAQKNLTEIIKSLRPGDYPDIEYIFCYTEIDKETEARLKKSDNIILYRSTKGSLIPDLWRDGILLAHADYIAITTAHCVPDENWVKRLYDYDFGAYAGVGGVIDNYANSDNKGWAIYFLRYIAYASPQKKREIADFAADNGVYSNELLLANKDLLADGFWEPDFHRKVIRDGKKLLFDPSLRVVHQNRYTGVQFFKQRIAHGFNFGMSRAHTFSKAKLLMYLLAFPLLPVMFFIKILKGVLNKKLYLRQFIFSLPWLIFFLVGWSLGEMRGYISGAK